MSFDINEHLDLIKSDVMGWINQAIASANINGITITTSSVITATLPPYVAYTNVSQAFIEKQSFQATHTDASGLSIATVYTVAWVAPTADDTGIKIGTWSTAATTVGEADDTGGVWGVASYGTHYGTGLIGSLAGTVAAVENVNAGNVTTAMAVSGQVKNSGAGTITSAIALYAQAPTNTGGGVITNAYGLNVGNQGLAGATAAYGLNIAAQSGATTNYAIYTAGGQLNLNDASVLTSGSYISVSHTLTSTPASASSAAFTGAVFRSSLAGTQNVTGSTVGASATSKHLGSGTLATAYGATATVTNESTGTITSAIALRAAIGVLNAGATITSAYGIYADAVSYTAGTLTSIAQVAIVAPGQGTNRTNLLIGTATIPSGTWNIYSTSTEPSYFAGRVVMAEISIPSAPAANQLAVYAKDNGSGVTKLYTLDSASTETELGGGGAGAPTTAQYVTLATDGTLSAERVLTAGANITLTDAGAGSTVTVAANTKHIATLTPLNSEAPSASYATIDSRNGHYVLDFSGTADEETVFKLELPAWYAGGGLTVDLWCSFTSATSGSVRWQAGIERDDVSSLDIDADSFAAFQSVGGTAPGTSGQFVKVSITFTSGAQMDSAAAGEMIRLKIRRDADGTSGTDDITTDAELLCVVVRET